MQLTDEEQSRLIEMAWEDRTPFEAIWQQFSLTEADTIQLMRRWLKPRSFQRWRQRVNGRTTKHGKLRPPTIERGYCPTQYKPRGRGKSMG